MCWSPEVDLIAAAGIAVVAADALRHNREGRTLPLALLPALFSVHTASSAVIWWAAEGALPAAAGEAAARFFMFVAFALLPVYVPVAVLLIEPPGWRRGALLALGATGLVSGVSYLLPLAQGEAAAVACDYYIAFTIDGAVPYAGFLYVVATVGALLFSGHHALMLWGVVNAAAVALLSVWTQAGLPSLWCFWAACTSVFIAWFLRTWPEASTPEPQPPRSGEASSVVVAGDVDDVLR